MCIVEIDLCAYHEVRHVLCKSIEPRKVGEGLVHDVEGPGIDGQFVEDTDLSHRTACNAYKAGNGASEVHQRVNVDGALVPAELCPWEQRQAQVDSGGVERIGGMSQLDAEALVGI